MNRGYIYVILSAVGYATLPIMIKIGYQLNITLDMLLTMRFFIASIILLVFMVITKSNNINGAKANLTRLILQGLLFFGCAYCLTSAVKYLDASLTSILLYLYPIIVVVLMTMFFREIVNIKKIIALTLTFIGCLMVIGTVNESFNMNWKGLLYGLGAASIYALYNINGQYLTGKLEPIAIATYVMIVCFIATSLAYPPVTLIAGNQDLSVWLVGGGMAVICTALPTILYLKGISELGASKSAIVSTVEPAFTIMLAGLVLGESLEILQLFGGLFIIAGVIALNINKLSFKYSRSADNPI